MTTDNQPTVQSIMADARLAGLPLTEEEAGQLLKGVRRNREMAETVRKVIEASVEPAPVFDARSASSRKE